MLPLDQGRLSLLGFLDRCHGEFPHRAFSLDEGLAVQTRFALDGIMIEFLKKIVAPPPRPTKLIEITITATRNSDGFQVASICWAADDREAHRDIMEKLASLYALGIYDHTYSVSCKKA